MCLEAGDEVVALSRSPEERTPQGARATALDLADADATLAAVRDAAPQVVYHLAALASVPESWEHPRRVVTANPLITLNVLEAVRAAAPGARVVVVGTGEVYGPPERLPVDEDAPLRPQNPYAVSKAAGDLLAGMYADAHGLAVSRVRAFNHGGPGQTPDYVVAALARQVAAATRAGERRVRVVTGNPEPRRDFTDVRDVARAYRLLAERAAPGAYNVCSGRTASVRDLLAMLEATAEVEIEHVVDPDLVRAHDVMEVRGSHERLTAATGWEPEIPLERTLADTVAWWVEQLALDSEAAPE
ncbi:MAG: GDP-mannose 4,6-dehydratase [Actinomycetota bacterium]|nr:GDP-mannose 4,6-dehydratase [Actinomycetota bacterium]